MDKSVLAQGGLYLITDSQSSPQHRLDQVEQALAAGAGLLQYRDKSADKGQALAHAQALQQRCQYYNVPFLINDDVLLAKQCQADGVHLGQDDTALPAARDYLGPQAIIGISCYNQLDRAQHMQQLGADYVAFGRFYPSQTKPDAPQADLAVLQAAKQQLNCPLVAIGGILPHHVPMLRQAGADWCAVIHGVFGQPNIRAAVQAYTSISGTGNKMST